MSFSVDNATVVETSHSQGASLTKPKSVELNNFLFSDSDFDSSPLKQCNRSRNDKSLNEKVQEKSPNRLDPRGSPAVGPSNDSSSSKSAHSRKRKLDRPTYFSNTNVSRVYSSSTHNKPNNKTLNTNYCLNLCYVSAHNKPNNKTLNTNYCLNLCYVSAYISTQAPTHVSSSRPRPMSWSMSDPCTCPH